MASVLNIYGDIVQEKVYSTDVTASDVKDFVEGLEENEELNVYINSFGGHVDAGLAIYQTIKGHKGKTKVQIDGVAASIASIMAFAGDELIVPESSILMIHLPFVGIVGNKIDLQRQIDALVTIENSLMSIYTNNLRDKADRQKISDFLHEEKWFSAEEIDQYFKVTMVKESESSEPAAKGLKKFKQKNGSESKDPAETYKQKVLKKLKGHNPKEEEDPAEKFKQHVLKRMAAQGKKQERKRVQESKSVLSKMKKTKNKKSVLSKIKKEV